MDIYKRALGLTDEIISHRRYIHQNAEVGKRLPKTSAYVAEFLDSLGIGWKQCGCGITATVGEGYNTVLLRADMDALPMKEESGETFSSSSDCAAHTCGHDLHCAMLLGATRILSEIKNELCGTVKLMFQPAEEPLTGCFDMISSGLLRGPAPSAAFAVHVGAGKLIPGVFMYNADSVMMLSADTFRIDITGHGGHAAYPHMTVDPLRIACNIYSFLESLTAGECDPASRAFVTVGMLNGGNVGNVIPDTACIEGSVRTDSAKEREKLKLRIAECSKAIAEMLGGSARVSFKAGVPPMICDKDLTEKAISYMQELSVPWRKAISGISVSASDDFALIAEKIPSAYIYLSAGFDDRRGDCLAHDPRVRFNEDVCPVGAAVYAQLAVRYLEDSMRKSC